MASAYDRHLRTLAKQVADDLQMRSFVFEGVYFYQAGPCYETIAEIRMARALGADVVGTPLISDLTKSQLRHNYNIFYFVITGTLQMLVLYSAVSNT